MDQYGSINTIFIFQTGVIIKVAKGGSMNELLYAEWLREVLAACPAAMFNPPTLLIDDQATCHKSEQVAKLKNVKHVQIPKGCTPILQPLDVCINKPFKTIVKAEWKKFIDVPEDDQVLTKGGKRKRVGL